MALGFVFVFFTSHCVYVFTIDGEYVTSFGRVGQKEGDFNRPYYVYVDYYGFICITGCYNNHVQCF